MIEKGFLKGDLFLRMLNTDLILKMDKKFKNNVYLSLFKSVLI